MIKIEKTTIHGWKEAIRGMRNPMNSCDKSDSFDMNAIPFDKIDSIAESMIAYTPLSDWMVIGENDYNLMLKLAKGGSVHAKYRRMIVVYCFPGREVKRGISAAMILRSLIHTIQ